ncbi:hypothetical protein [Xanthomonas phage SB4]|uniref:Uncharacterized protein n=1 Tax=Xanthomonas phage SB4 TaxID=3117473 RepID=A0ABZ2GZJ3_9CAUD
MSRAGKVYREYRIIYLPTGRLVKTVTAHSVLSAKRAAGYHDWQLHVVKEVQA